MLYFLIIFFHTRNLHKMMQDVRKETNMYKKLNIFYKDILANKNLGIEK